MTDMSKLVKVKPLEWHPVKSEDAFCHDHWVAPALGGAFHIAPDEDSAAGFWILQWTICHEDFCMAYGGAITKHVCPEAAKAAAQADYAAVIFAALEPTEPVGELVEVLRWYKDQMCEGFCKDLPQRGTFNSDMLLDCAGCNARATLAKIGE